MMTEPGDRQRETQPVSCNVSMKFNFTMGTLAIAAAIGIGYLLWNWLR